MGRIRNNNESKIKLFRVCKKRNKNIEPYLVNSTTEDGEVINSLQYLKPYSNYDYFLTWEAAHQHMIKKAESDIEHAQKILDNCKLKLNVIKGMKKPVSSNNIL